tara:strand:+ start:11153 stop:13876 length:2724 start_codon:yes stop_codon:yes gene_type:complete
MSTLAEEMAALGHTPDPTKSTLANEMAALGFAANAAPTPTEGEQVAGKYKDMFATEPTEPTMFQRTADVGAKIFETPRGIIDLPYTALKLSGALGEKMGIRGKGSTDSMLGLPTTQREPLKSFFDGVTTPRVNREENPATRALGTGLSWAMPLPVSKLSNLSSIPDVLMGAGAAAGEYLGGDIGEVGGGVGGLIAGLLRGKIMPSPVDSATRQAEEFTTKMIGDTAEESVDTIDSLKQGGELGNLTLADATKNPTMYDVERTMTATPEGSVLRQDIEQMVAKAEAATLKQASDVIPTVDSGAARLAAKRQLESGEEALDAVNSAKTDELTAGLEGKKNTARALEGQMGRELSDSKDLVAALRANANVAQGTVAGANTPVNASRSIFDEYNRLEENMNVPMKEAYARIDNAPKVDASKAVEELDKWFKTTDIDPTQLKDFTAKYRKNMDEILSLKKKTVRPKEIDTIVKKMNKKIEDAREGGIRKLGDNDDRIALGVVKKLEDALNIPDNVSGFSGFADAKKAAKAKFDATLPETVGTARKANVPETFTDTLNYTGKAGAQTARLADQANNPAVLQGHFDVIAAEAREAGRFGGKGVDDAFMKNYGGFLDRFPNESAKYQKIADANRVASVATKEGAATQSALNKAVTASQESTSTEIKGLSASLKKLNKITVSAKQELQKGAVEAYSKEPKDSLALLLTPKKEMQKGKTLTELNDWSKAEGINDAFKGDVKDVLMDRLFPESGAGLRQATGASAKAFRDVKDNLVKSDILTQKQADDVYTALKSNAGRQAAREAAGLTTVTYKVTPEEKRLAGIAAVAAVSSTGIPHALFAVGFTRRMIEQTMVNMKLSDAGKAKIAEFITDPEKYAEAFKLMKTINAAGSQPSAAKLATVARAIVGSGNINQSSED